MLSGIICESSEKSCAKRLDISLNEYRLILGKFGAHVNVQCFDCPIREGEEILEENDRYRVVKEPKSDGQ